LNCHSPRDSMNQLTPSDLSTPPGPKHEQSARTGREGRYAGTIIPSVDACVAETQPL
jgi:hypothetical protein